jgi:hypothetical protein
MWFPAYRGAARFSLFTLSTLLFCSKKLTVPLNDIPLTKIPLTKVGVQIEQKP